MCGSSLTPIWRDAGGFEQNFKTVHNVGGEIITCGKKSLINSCHINSLIGTTSAELNCDIMAEILP